MIICKYDCGIYKKEFNLLVCHPRYELTADRMNDIAICRECVQKEGLVQTNRFHDLTDITSVHLDFNEVRQICESESKLRSSERPIKACYLVPNTLLYGTIRMYQSLIESSGVEVCVSYDINELAGVLGVEVAVLTTIPII
jgi:hypothetical protein